MERRQKWLESQFRRHDERLSKMAKQLQVLQDFISLNFDSYRQYAQEREREDRINHLTYGNVDKPHHHHSHLSQGHSYPHQDGSPLAHSQYPSRMTPLPAPDLFHSRHGMGSHNMINSESDYDDGETMDPAPGESDAPPSTIGSGLLAIAAVDLSTDKRRYQQPQEPNSTTVTDYSVGVYYGVDSQCGRGEGTPPDSGLVDEGPTDLSTEKKYSDDHASLYHGTVTTHGSILGGILSSHIQPKIKAEITEEDETGSCYNPYPRSSTASTDSSSKDKEYSSQSLWSAGTMTTVACGIGSGSAGSTDEIAEELPRRTKGRRKSAVKKEKASQDLKKYPLTQDTTHFNDSSSEAMKKSSSSSMCSPGVGTGRGGHKKRRVSNEENASVPSSTASSTLEHTASTTTTSTGRKGGSANSNASKQCRFCGKTFQWLHSVKTHERLHTGIKPYACKICGARFTQNGNLKVHAKTCVEKHAESYKSRNVLICSVCTEMFSETDALMDHQKSHDRMQWTIKEKTCQLCGEVFQKRSFLLEHEKVHVQDRSFLTSLGIEAEAKDAAVAAAASSSTTTGNSGNSDEQ